VVSDTRGRPWHLGSPDFLATTRALHPAAVEVLSTIPQLSADQKSAEPTRSTP
jgi:hypothetical protein